MSGRTPLAPDTPLPDISASVLTKRRMTFRSNVATTTPKMRFRLYAPRDATRRLLLWPGADFELDRGEERAVIIPPPVGPFLATVQIQCRPVAGAAAELSLPPRRTSSWSAPTAS